jgi:16S rRNA processing protein RimM
MLPATTTASERVCVGVVTGAHGVRGALRIKSFTANPAHVAAYGEVTVGEGEDSAVLRITGEAKGAVVAEIAGVTDRDAAQALKGKKLYVPRSALPEAEEGEYYHDDLVGLEVRSPEGEALGTIAAVHNYGAGDILDIRTSGQERDGKNGADMMLPFTREVVPEVNLEAGYVVAEPPHWTDDNDDENGGENGSEEQ